MARRTDRQSRAFGWVVAGVVGALMLVFGAFTFTNALSTRQTLEEAAALHAADMTLAAQDVALKSVGQLVLAGQDYELGVASRQAVDSAAVEAQRAISELRSRSEALGEEGSESVPAAIDDW